MTTMPIDDLAHLLMSAPKGPEDLLVDLAEAHRTLPRFQAAADRLAERPASDPDRIQARGELEIALRNFQFTRGAYCRAAGVLPYEAELRVSEWMIREKKLKKDMRQAEAEG